LLTTPVIQLARGILMTLAALPIIYTLRMRRWPAALAVGALLWVAGGASLLLAPNALMTAAQRYVHMIEILTENMPLGITGVATAPQARSCYLAADGNSQ
jgi:hypothetical protein